MHSMHSALPTCQPPFMVRTLQLVEVRPYAGGSYAEEEEERIALAIAAPTYGGPEPLKYRAYVLPRIMHCYS